jgi:hypothetical protein
MKTNDEANWTPLILVVVILAISIFAGVRLSASMQAAVQKVVSVKE